ncbi:DUF4007 family protein [Hallella sp.]|uniref:DUF4007 family protein n=2 Tax=Hallella sp. TaxID=2980186 RepID=UPI002590D72A|nr:DUF4007 family protein [Hallella sp.]MDD7145619.1 DUF4007 family protein [Hallella sp.]
MYSKYVFSGHESFSCRMLWPIKGYDYINDGNSFNDPNSVIMLGVGKNMVASIRYWLKALGLTEHDKPSTLAKYLFDEAQGKDRYLESLGTLWLLHFLLVVLNEATLYNILFLRYQKERKQFAKEQVLNFVKRLMAEDDRLKQFNSNTVGKDFGVLVQNYVQPSKPKSYEDYSSLLIDLNLIRNDNSDRGYAFNIEGKRTVPTEIFLYAVLWMKGSDRTVSYDTLQNVGLVFCMTDMEVIEMLQQIDREYSEYVQYSDNAGIRQLLFKEGKQMNPIDLLNRYYDNAAV